MAQTTRVETAENVGEGSVHEGSHARLTAAGSVLGALAASSRCILPLVLFSLGISGAWIANFTAPVVRWSRWPRGTAQDARPAS